MTADEMSQKKKRQTFKQTWDKAFSDFEKQRQRQHFSLTPYASFNALLEMFGGNYFNVITKPNTAKSRWTTHTKHPIAPRQLHDLYTNPDTIVGLRFTALTLLLILDIDRYSPYHPLNDEAAFRRLLSVLASLGLEEYSLKQSSTSGGVHLYLPLPERMPSWLAALTLTVALENAGFTIKDGILELFPNLKGYTPEKIINYKGIRLPLQPHSGSVVLDSMLYHPIHDSLDGLMRTLEAQAQCQDMGVFKRAMKAAYEGYYVRYGRPYQRQKGAKAFAAALQATLAPGWTGRGQTNDLVLTAVKQAFVFWRLDGAELISKTAAYLRGLPGYTEWCGHQHEIEQRVQDWLKSVKALGYYPYDGQYRDRLCQPGDYGIQIETTQASQRQREDRRHSNPANKAKTEDAKQRLIQVVRLIRAAMRDRTMTASLESYRQFTMWFNETAREHLGKGFSNRLLQKVKSLLERLYRYAQRVTRHVLESPPPECQETQVNQPLPPSLTDFLPNDPAPTLENPVKSTVTAFSGIYEGGGAAASPLALLTSWRAAQRVLRYTGSVIGSLVQLAPNNFKNLSSDQQREILPTLKRQQSFTCQYLRPGDLVQLTQEQHSQAELTGLVYVKPLEKPWLSSIAVLYHFLIPQQETS